MGGVVGVEGIVGELGVELEFEEHRAAGLPFGHPPGSGDAVGGG